MNLCNSKYFEKVYVTYSDGLYKYLLYKYQDSETAEDVTQNVFLKIWEECKKFHQENLKGLIYTMGNNLFLNKLKRKKTHQNFVLNSTEVYQVESPEFVLETKEFDKRLQSLLGKLNPDDRATFLMNRIDKKKYHEIADQLGISIKTVEKRIHKVLVFLRSEIKEFNH